MSKQMRYIPPQCFQRELSGSVTPQGLSQLELSLLECESISQLSPGYNKAGWPFFQSVTADYASPHTFYTESLNSMALINLFLKQ